jgi:hypothetical protein
MRWSPQTSSMVLLLTSQLRPLSYRLLPCTSSSALWRGRPAYRWPVLPHTRVKAAWQRMSSTASQCGNTRLAEQTAFCPVAPKKRRTQTFSVPQRRPKCAWINTPKLPQVTFFTIITNAMRRPLVARGVGDLGPAKAESPTLLCLPNLLRYFLTYYVTY